MKKALSLILAIITILSVIATATIPTCAASDYSVGIYNPAKVIATNGTILK